MKRFDQITDHTLCILLLLSPFVVIKPLFNYANLPQTVFIQTVVSFLLILWCVKVIIERHVLFIISPIHYVVFLFLVWTILSIAWAQNRFESLLVLNHWLACGVVFYLICNRFNNNHWANKYLISILAALTGILLIGCSQYFFNIEWIPQSVPPAATFGNENMAAQFVNMVVPITLVLFFSAPRKYFQLFLLISFLLSSLYLFSTNCRAGWIAWILYLFIITAAVLRDSRAKDSLIRISKKAVVSILIILCIPPILVFVKYQDQIHDMYSIYKHKITQPLEDIETLKYRLAMWKNGFEMVRDRPITGFGLGNFQIYYPIYHLKTARDFVFSAHLQARTIHNDFIQIGIELGLVGVVLFISMFFIAFFMIFKLFSPQHPPKIRLLVMGLLGSLIGFSVHSVFSFPMQRAMPPLLLFVYFGILGALFNQLIACRRNFLIKVPRKIGIPFLAILLFASLMLLKFNINNIISDRYYKTALQAEQAGDWSKVIDSGLKASEYNPHNLRALSAVGLAFVKSNQVFDGIEKLKRVLNGYPYDLNAMFNLAAAYQQAGNIPEAVKTYHQVLGLKPDYPAALINLGSIYMKDRAYNAALKLFVRAEKKDRHNALIKLYIGNLKFMEGRFREAAEAFEKALTLEPKMPHVLRTLGGIYLKLNQPDKAREHMEAYVQLKPDDRTSNLFRKIMRAMDLNQNKL